MTRSRLSVALDTTDTARAAGWAAGAAAMVGAARQAAGAAGAPRPMILAVTVLTASIDAGHATAPAEVR